MTLRKHSVIIQDPSNVCTTSGGGMAVSGLSLQPEIKEWLIQQVGEFNQGWSFIGLRENGKTRLKFLFECPHVAMRFKLMFS